jgi:type I restriction enzyme M protein
MSDVVQKLWGFCHTLRHDGIDYGDYIEQITFLLFLKMAHERDRDLRKLPFTTAGGKKVTVDCSWPTLAKVSGTSLTAHYADILRVLSQQPGTLGDIYAEAQSKFNNPVNLKRLINLIDETHWTELDVDVKAEAYEGLLEKAASEGKKGAGQYFTPRVLIQSIVRCMKPDPRVHSELTICDPPVAPAVSWWLRTSGCSMKHVAARCRAMLPNASGRRPTTARSSWRGRGGWR